MYDVAIIGAGLAGSTLARLIGRKYKVLLVEKSNGLKASGTFSPGKCCGGLLAPDAQKMLALMGLGVPHEVLAGPQLFAVRTIDIMQHLERYYQRSYLNIDRAKFDSWLLSLVPSGVDVLRGSFFHALEQDLDGITLHLSRNAKPATVRTRVLVGADGAFSQVRKKAFPLHSSPKTYIALQESVKTEAPLPYFTAIFDPEITDFYSWIIPKHGSLLIGSALQAGESARPTFELFKDKLKDWGFVFGKSIQKSGALILRPSSLSQICIGSGPIALVGEAAGWISPSSAEGMSYAFRSALALADALDSGLVDFQERYRRNIRSLKGNILLKNLKSPVMYNPLLRKLVMSSGLNSMEPFSPTVV
jgi:geranylgeranyl diphosphate/geranylgeranyl-bacteriochlorophyllide a reductase